MNKEFLSILKRSEEIHHKKNQDYTSGTNVDENFERVAEIVSWFKHPIDKSFAGFIAVKLARIASLLNKSDSPKFESIDDTFVDLVTYAGLWGGNVARRLNDKQSNDYVGKEIQGHSFRIPLELNPVSNFKHYDDQWDSPERVVAMRPLDNKIHEVTPKERKLHEIINMFDDLDEDNYRELLSLARILKSRKKVI